jgi:hypothetical protein
VNIIPVAAKYSRNRMHGRPAIAAPVSGGLTATDKTLRQLPSAAGFGAVGCGIGWLMGGFGITRGLKIGTVVSLAATVPA